MCAANPGVNPQTLQVGQVLNLPSGGSAPPSSGGGSSVGGGFVEYGGPTSNFPDPANWASWE
ncbi:hypothetical protein SLS64_014116 [Diaporthe eres]|uniref:LysM domain-containing protein n=1 Tax=Diaporthe eres TaxID=83184 RepID=A0ABR1NLA1_DIAER